jgi:hypothetical protein
MRLIILTAALALSLAACGKNSQTDNAQMAGADLTADNIVSNDVTAIDAVTGDAANMAADVNYSGEMDNSLDNEMANAAKAERPKPTAKPRPRAAAPGSDSPSGNALSNSGD